MKVKDHFLSQEEFELVKNQKFGFLETSPQPLDTISTYYQSENYISHSDSSESFMDRLYQKVKKWNLNYKYSKIKNKNSNLSILDYGCGTGDFLQFAKNKGNKVFGIEPDQKASNLAKHKIGQNLISNHSIFEVDQKFDVITLWHVLEHIPNLMEFIPELNKKLNSGGEILIAVPNFKSFDSKFYKSYWAAYDVPRHLWHFDPKSLENLFSHFGMIVDKTYPLWFDSYYISFLSEKYKKSKIGVLRAIFIGSISNFLGLFTGNYSSVIFRIRKEF